MRPHRDRRSDAPGDASAADRGSVIVEAALVIPVLILVTTLLVWAASLGATYVRALDAAQTAARQAARGAPDVPAPEGFTLALDSVDGLVRATVTQHVSPPVAAFTGWGVTVSAEAHAVPESPFFGGEPDSRRAQP